MYNNPFYKPVYNQMTPTIQPPYLQATQPLQSISNQIGLLGKMVESLEVVKSMDIPLDGSISYFPLTNGSAIVSKQLQNDGTSKTIVYRPVEEKEKEKDEIKYVTFDDLQGAINGIDLSDLEDLQDLKDEIKELKKQIKDMKKSKEEQR